MLKATIHNVDIAYDDHGMGHPFLFLHGFPLNRSMWEGPMAALLVEQQFRLVALDWPGFGESSIISDVSTMELFADIVAGLMDTLGMQQAVLCGLSMGGYAALAFLRKYPQRLTGLILADTRPGADTAEGKTKRETLAQLAESQGTSAIADTMLPGLISDTTRQQHLEVERRVRHMISTASVQGIAAASRGMAQRADSTDLLAYIACPTLVVVGEQDVLIPPRVAQDYAAQIPNARFVAIPQAGHLSSIERPEAFLTAIQNFLQEQICHKHP